MPKVRADGLRQGTERAPNARMAPAPIQRQAQTFETAHEAVCRRCGHGESLHALRQKACLLCDQRTSAGLPSESCAGFLSDRPDMRAAE